VFYVEIMVWIAVLAGAWLIVRRIEARPALQTRARLATVTVAIVAGAVMTAASIVWRLERADGVTAGVAQLDLLRAAGSETRFIAVDLSQRRRLTAGQLPESMTISTEAMPFAPGMAGTIAAICAARHPAALSPDGEPARDGGWRWWDRATSSRSCRNRRARSPRSAAPLSRGSCAIVVRGDEDARRAGGLRLRPFPVLEPAGRPRQGAVTPRHGAATMFFMDDRSFPEPGVLGREAQQPPSSLSRTRRPSVAVIVRNAPVEIG
jgi:hypothetical protein